MPAGEYASSGGGGGSFTSPQLGPNGAAGAPSYSFTGSPGTGMFSPATNVGALSADSIEAVRWVKDSTGAFPNVGIGQSPDTTVALSIKSQTNSATSYALYCTNSVGTILLWARSSGQILAGGPLLVNQSGSFGGPALQIATSNTGLYSPSANALGITTNGAAAVTISNAQLANFINAVQIQSAASIRSGSATPNSNVTGSVGDIYLWTGGAAGTTLWVKESGAATNTGWVSK